MTALQVKLYSPLNFNSAPASASPTSPPAPASLSADDVNEHLADIQFVAQRCANTAQLIITKEATLLRPNSITPQADPDHHDAADNLKPARSFSYLPETAPVSELTTIKALLEDIWQATMPLSGSAFLLASSSLLLRHRVHNITRDISWYLEAVYAELQSWLGADDDGEPTTPLTPVSMYPDDDDSMDSAFAQAPVESIPTKSAPPSHVSLVLDIMLALLEASSVMIAAVPRFHSEHSIGEAKESVSACLDRARFQEHMYHPEDEGVLTAYAVADRLGIKSLEAHVSGLTSYLWLDFGDSMF